jgi:hypothetical protein
MGTLEEEREQARKLGRQINHDARSNVDSPYAGKVVGILHGEVVIVADTLDEVAEALERLEPGPQRRYRRIWVGQPYLPPCWGRLVGNAHRPPGPCQRNVALRSRSIAIRLDARSYSRARTVSTALRVGGNTALLAKTRAATGHMA